ncbi:aspartate--tRNA ligase [Omnitrophica bacterium]|nr:aspartate--tRNA ligase [Candidatus Omnitrophota bacterium]
MLRTANCGELNLRTTGRQVTLAGWVDTYRDHGELLFIDIRDRWGITQIVFNPAVDADLHREAKKLRPEFVIQVIGKVQKRPDGTVNSKIPTGEIEIHVAKLEVLNDCPTTPFEITETSVNEELRLKYRFLDLRRPEMVESLSFRYRMSKIARDFLDRHLFLEIETPMLTKSTPEGARDYLVPARLSPNMFYALPQSPQLFKQLLMVAGYDRYYQLARCFRDEDLRADRQPEHTQIDMEMSFVEDEDVMKVVESMVVEVIEKMKGVRLPTPLLRMDYHEAMDRYGSDKPDLRFEMELKDLTEPFTGSGFKVFDQVISSEGKIRGLCFSPPEGIELSRKNFDDLTEWIQAYGAKGLAWFKVVSEEEVESPIKKFFDAGRIRNVLAALNAKAGDVVFMVASDPGTSAVSLGALRLHLAERYGLIPANEFKALWVVNFPMFDWNEDEKRWDALHHPFTSPRKEDLPLLDTDPGKVRARAYDLVLNGTELGGGSIRIHSKDVQSKVFKTLNISAEDAEEKFGFLLKALSYGAPPHGGLAIGLDRFAAILLGRKSIREVIAFPKTQKGTCLMTDAPSHVSPRQLKELHLSVKT